MQQVSSDTDVQMSSLMPMATVAGHLINPLSHLDKSRVVSVIGNYAAIMPFLILVGCKEQSETLFWRVASVLPSSVYSDVLSDRTRFPSFFRVFPNSEGLAFGILSVIKHFNWTRVLFLTQQESLFIKISNDFKHTVNGLNIKATEYQFSSEQNKFTDILSNYFDTQPDYRVIVVNTYADIARKILYEK
eukprot:Em0010g1050a